MSAPARVSAARSRSSGGQRRVREPQLECRLRLADGRVFRGEVPAARHRAIQLGMLHAKSVGFVEITPGTRLPDGRLELDRRSRPEHFLPAGRQAGKHWLDHAERIIAGAYARRRFADGPREECFVGVAARTVRAGGREHVGESRWLWVDVDDGDRLDRLYAFLAERPCHLIVQTAGRAGGVHCYWRLDRPLPATQVNAMTGELVEPIERANMRLIGALGADPQCRDRGRLLRLAGCRNWKTGRFAWIDHADLPLAPYSARELVGDLADPDRSGRPARPVRDEHDPYRRIPAGEYMARVLGLRANRAGFVRCPAPGHEDRHPSCRIGGEDPTLWRCFACEAAGSIYDAASLRLGGPFGHGRLRGEDFKRARALVIELYGELDPLPVG